MDTAEDDASETRHQVPASAEHKDLRLSSFHDEDVHDEAPGKQQGRTWGPKATDLDHAVSNPRNQTKI